MPIHVTKETVLDAPVEKVFEYVANYRNVGEWLSGVSSFTPVGDLDYGLHSVFDAALMTYELPGGIAGRAMGKAIEPLIALVVKHSADHLAKHFSA